MREALAAADRPHVLVTDLSPGGEPTDLNLHVSELRFDPPLLKPGDTPRLIATVQAEGTGLGRSRLSLYVDEKLLEARAIAVTAPGRTDTVFELPPIGEDARTARLSLDRDAMPADDDFHFLLAPSPEIRVAVVTEAPGDGSGGGEGSEAAWLVTRAIEPDDTAFAARSPFGVRAITPAALARSELPGFAAVVLVDVPPPDPVVAERLEGYVRDGGLLLVFPSSRTPAVEWNRMAWLGAEFGTLETSEPTPRRLVWSSPSHAATRGLETEWLDRMKIRTLFGFTPGEGTQTLMVAEGDRPFLLLRQIGRGKAYLFAVDGGLDASNLAYNPILLVTLHQAIGSHLVEAVRAPWRSAGEPVRVPDLPTDSRVFDPDGAEVVVAWPEDRTAPAVLRFADRAGVYRIARGEEMPTAEETRPLVALNVPAAESTVERIDRETIRDLIGESRVTFHSPGGGAAALPEAGAEENRSGSAGFVFAVLAVAFLLGEARLARSLSRLTESRAGREAGPMADG